jgi:hypothetical protein
MYVAPSGLDEITHRYSCGVATGYYITPLRGFSDSLLDSDSSELFEQRRERFDDAFVNRAV